MPDRSNAPVVGRHQTAGQERLFAATIGTTGFHRTGRPSKTGGDLDCRASCPLSGQINGAPGRTRTSCLRFRKPPLCPGELRELVSPEDAGARPCALRHGCIRALRARSSHRRALTRPGCGGLRRRVFVKLPLAGSCPGRVSAALGCVPLSASPLLFERQSFQRPFGPWSGSISTWRRQIRNRFRPILEIRGSVSLRARLAGATGLRSARLSVLRNVIGESWTGVSPVR